MITSYTPLSESGKTLEPYLTEDLRDRMLVDEQTFIGLGNNAWVFALSELDGNFCSKNLWPSLSVECRSHDYQRLPPLQRRARRIQDYFAEVKAHQRALLSKGIGLLMQNTPTREAEYNNEARDIAAGLGWAGMVPQAHAVQSYEREELGTTSAGERYMFDETANAIIFDRVNGPSIQDYILKYDRYPGLSARIDLDVFRSRLESVLGALSRTGWHHNDVSNRNIMIDAPTGEPRLIDFGASSSHGGDLDRDLEHLADCLNWLRRAVADPATTRAALLECLG